MPYCILQALSHFLTCLTLVGIGVTCWEIFSLGLQPYPSVGPFEMSDYLKSRKVLDKPSLSCDKM